MEVANIRSQERYGTYWEGRVGHIQAHDDITRSKAGVVFIILGNEKAVKVASKGTTCDRGRDHLERFTIVMSPGTLMA